MALALILSSYLAEERPEGIQEEEAARFIWHYRAANRMVEGPGFKEALGDKPWPPTAVNYLEAEPTSVMGVSADLIITPPCATSEESPSLYFSHTIASSSDIGTSECDSERALLRDTTTTEPRLMVSLERSSISSSASSTIISDLSSLLVTEEIQRLARTEPFHELDRSVIEILSEYTDDLEPCFF
jgi:hypothetical protein